MGLIETRCVCSGKSAQVIAHAEGLSVGRCRNCGLIRTLEREESYRDLYVEGDRYHVAQMDKINRPHYNERFDHDKGLGLSRLRKIRERQRALDVGCANGGFLAALVEEGYNAEGLELNPSMARFAQDSTGCTVHTSWDTVEGHFDYIVYNDVFEHVEEPTLELQRLRNYLRFGGVLVIDQPDAEEVFSTDYQPARAPHHLKPTQHLWFWDEVRLARLLKTEGFVVFAVDRPIVGKLVTYARYVA